MEQTKQAESTAPQAQQGERADFTIAIDTHNETFITKGGAPPKAVIDCEGYLALICTREGKGSVMAQGKLPASGLLALFEAMEQFGGDVIKTFAEWHAMRYPQETGINAALALHALATKLGINKER